MPNSVQLKRVSQSILKLLFLIHFLLRLASVISVFRIVLPLLRIPSSLGEGIADRSRCPQANKWAMNLHWSHSLFWAGRKGRGEGGENEQKQNKMEGKMA
jgi:hypothetical protein